MLHFKLSNWRTFVALLCFGIFVTFQSCQKDEARPDGSFSDAPPADLKTQVDNFGLVLSNAMADVAVRDFIRTEAILLVDNDYDVVYGMVKDRTLANGSTFKQTLLSYEQEAIASGQTSVAVIANILRDYPLLNISVPVGALSWNTNDYEPAVITLPPYNMYGDTDHFVGRFSDGSFTRFSAETAPNQPVVVVGENERMIHMNDGSYMLDHGLVIGNRASNARFEEECFQFMLEPIDCIDGGGFGGGGGTSGGGTSGSTNCGVNFNVRVYLDKLKSENLGCIEGWIAGAPELRLNIGAGLNSTLQLGQNIYEGLFEPRRRRDIDNRWWERNDYLYRWRTEYGDVVSFIWVEEDGGIFSQESIPIEIEYKGLSVSYQYPIPIFLRPNRTMIGNFPVDRDDCVGTEIYGTPCLKFQLDVLN